jgi:uncharacterized membrane protein YccC
VGARRLPLTPAAPPSARRSVVERVLRVVVAACTGFYLCLYGFDSTQAAVYAVFGVLALGGLSDVSGPPRSRLQSYLLAFALGVPLVTLGTVFAQSTLLAVAGMLVVGLLVGMSATAGGRVQGLANGLQLLYILPSFPPYDLGALPDRLLGLALGVVLLVVADVLVAPQHGAPGYERRLADAVMPLVDYLGAVRGRICDPRPDGSPVSDDVRERAAAAVADLATERLPVSRRPTGPSAYDHALRAAAMLLRVVHSRIAGMDRLIRRNGTLPVEPAAAALVDDVVVQLVACEATFDALVGGRRGAAAAVAAMPATPDLAALGRGVARYEAERLSAVESVVHMEVASETQLRFDSMTAELAEATAALVSATRSAALLPQQSQPVVLSAVPQFVPQTRRTWAQWLTNLAIHVHPRSVILQNSLRLALGLSLARLVAGVLDLSHGFWVLLATLTLMRTTTSATRGALRPVLLGTLVGAVLAGLLLALSGGHTAVFVVLLPVVMVVGLAATPLGHPAVGQAFFTLAVAALFSQVTPSSWQLAESRVVDVLVGAAIGLGTGVLVWPRGGAGPLRLALAGYVRETARLAQQSVARFADGVDELDARQLRATRSAEVLAAATYSQFMAESPAADDGVPELRSLLMLGRRLTDGAHETRVDRVHAYGGEPARAAGVLLDTMAVVRVAAIGVLVDAIARKEQPRVPPVDDAYDQMTAWLEEFHGRHVPAMALDVVDARSWLVGVGHDIGEVAELARR